MVTTSDAALRIDGDRSLCNTLRHLTRHAAGGQIVEQDGLMMFAGAHDMPHAYVNGVIRTSGTKSPDEMVERGRRFFGAKGRSFALWGSTHADRDVLEFASKSGLFSYRPEGSPEMALCGDPGPAALPRGLELEAVQDDATQRRFIEVTTRAYGHVLDAKAIAAVFANLDVLSGEHARAFVASRDGMPQAAAMITVFEGLGEVGFVGTVPDARGHGLGGMVTQACAHAAFAQGVNAVFLQASAMGEPVYRRLGFREITRYMRYDVAIE